MKRIVPLNEYDYEWVGEGLEILFKADELERLTGLDREDYDNFGDLYKAVQAWAIENDKRVWALNCYEHSGYAFSYIESEPRQGWDTYPVFLVADIDMWCDKPDIEYINGWYNGYLFSLEEKIGNEWEGADVLTDTQADEYIKKYPEVKRYEERTRTVTELVEVE